LMRACSSPRAEETRGHQCASGWSRAGRTGRVCCRQRPWRSDAPPAISAWVRRAPRLQREDKEDVASPKGEIYNYRGERRHRISKSAAHSFRSSLIRLVFAPFYEEFGEDSSHLNGMFALACGTRAAAGCCWRARCFAKKPGTVRLETLRLFDGTTRRWPIRSLRLENLRRCARIFR